MRTYDYILAMREENQFSGLEPLNDSDFSSDDSSEPASPKRPIVMSQFMRTNLVEPLQPAFMLKILNTCLLFLTY